MPNNIIQRTAARLPPPSLSGNKIVRGSALQTKLPSIAAASTSAPAPASGGGGGGGGGPPTGAAGGRLSGTYPNPGINAAGVASDLSSYFDAYGAAAAAQSAAETYARNTGNLYLDEFNVNAPIYGASPSNSAAANVTAITAAIAALNTAGGGKLIFPGRGNYDINAVLPTITVPCEVVGFGYGTTYIVQQAANTGIFVFGTGSDQSAIRRLNLNGPGSSTANYAIQIGVGAGVSDVVVEECAFTGGWYSNIQCVYAINSTRIVGNILGGGTHAIEVGPNSGTPMIVNNTGAGTISAVHLALCANGGYIIEGNYFDGGQYAILYDCPNGNDLDMYVVGNHIEDYTVAGIRFNTPSGTGQLANVVIVGNEFADIGGTTGSAISVNTGAYSGYFLQRILVTGNAIVNSVGLYGISLYYAEFCAISGNCFGLHGSTAGVYIDASCSNVEVCPTSNSFGFGTVFVTDNQTRTVATLQAASAFRGKRTYVTDATVTTFMSVVAGTGGNIVPVFSDGTNWRIG